jgi:acetyl esterase/lipase
MRILLFMIALLVSLPAAAGDATTETIRLWPAAPPGTGRPSGPERIGQRGSAKGAVSNVTEPRMVIFRPAKPNGAAALVIGGGGYFRIQIESAARPTAVALAARGVTVAILYYRLPGDGWNANAPFQDGQRALRLLRANATRLGIAPDRIGVLGFSAGGHLAGMLATRGGAEDYYPRIDEVDAQPGQPDYAALLYPVVSMQSPIDTTRTKRELSVLPSYRERFSVERHVTANTPPIFLAHAADDPIADVRHSLWLFDAMRAVKRPVELHVFEAGGHSWGVGKPGTAVAVWPELLSRWGRIVGWFGSAQRTPPPTTQLRPPRSTNLAGF